MGIISLMLISRPVNPAMTLAECYQLLKLQHGATLEEIDFAFSQQRIEFVRRGRKGEIAELTVAYHQLKDHTLIQNAEVETEPELHTPEQQIGEYLNRLLQPHKIRTKIKIVATELQIQLHSRVGTAQSQLAVQIVKFLQILDPAGIETVIIYGMHGNKSIGWKQKFQIDRAVQFADTDPFSFNNRYINRFALPIAIVLAIITQLLVFPRFFLRPIQIWVHEFGHATVAWLAGHQATPLPFGWTNVGQDRSSIVYCCFLSLLLLLFWSGWREQKHWAMCIAGVTALIQFYMTWIMSIDTYEMWLSFGGIGGEFYLSTLIMVCFYCPLPDKFRWDFWRYIALIFAACTFTESFWMWHKIKTGSDQIPWGTIFGGQGDAGGDMNNLSAYGWSNLQIINTYTQLGHICLFILIGIYLIFLLKSLESRTWRQQRK